MKCSINTAISFLFLAVNLASPLTTHAQYFTPEEEDRLLSTLSQKQSQDLLEVVNHKYKQISHLELLHQLYEAKDPSFNSRISTIMKEKQLDGKGKNLLLELFQFRKKYPDFDWNKIRLVLGQRTGKTYSFPLMQEAIERMVGVSPEIKKELVQLASQYGSSFLPLSTVNEGFPFGKGKAFRCRELEKELSSREI